MLGIEFPGLITNKPRSGTKIDRPNLNNFATPLVEWTTAIICLFFKSGTVRDNSLFRFQMNES